MHKLAGQQAQSCVIGVIALLFMIAGTPGSLFGEQVPPAPRGPESLLEMSGQMRSLSQQVAPAVVQVLVSGYGLNFSAMDLIVTPDDRYVFLENNPNGQFIFVEEMVPELAMTDALAACLIRGAGNTEWP